MQSGGGGSSATSWKPAKGWETSLNPGDSVAGILILGDLSATGTGTVTYNDGKHILAFGHPFMNLGPIDMPMAKSEIVMTLASSYQPNKLPNTTEVVGALHQDRFSGIMGELVAEAPMVPVHLKLRSLNEKNAVVKEKDFNFQVFVNQKYTPTLMMVTLASTIGADQRIRGRDYVSDERQRGAGRRRQTECVDHPGGQRSAGASAVDTGQLVGRKVQPPVCESGFHAQAHESGLHHRPAAGPARGGHRQRLDTLDRRGSGNRDSGEGVPAAVPG